MNQFEYVDTGIREDVTDRGKYRGELEYRMYDRGDYTSAVD